MQNQLRQIANYNEFIEFLFSQNEKKKNWKREQEHVSIYLNSMDYPFKHVVQQTHMMFVYSFACIFGVALNQTFESDRIRSKNTIIYKSIL